MDGETFTPSPLRRQGNPATPETRRIADSLIDTETSPINRNSTVDTLPPPEDENGQNNTQGGIDETGSFISPAGIPVTGGKKKSKRKSRKKATASKSGKKKRGKATASKSGKKKRKRKSKRNQKH